MKMNTLRKWTSAKSPVHPTMWLVAMFLILSAPIVGESFDPQRLPLLLGRPVGLIHMPRVHEASTLLSLAAVFPTAQVHGQQADPERLIALRREIDQAGLLNRRITVDQGDLSRLWPIGRSCDLVIFPDLLAEDLTPALAQEIRRILQPWYGVALLGQRSGDSKALVAWAQTIGAEALPVAELPGFVRVQAPALPGADNWPMWWHGPDNHAVSADTAYALDETFQWAGKPFLSAREELPIVADGRLFMLWNATKMGKNWIDGMSLASLEGDGPFVTAHASGSGQVLWAVRLSEAAWGQASRSVMVADGDSLFVADGGTILELDVATGKELKKIESGAEEIRWLAVVGEKVLFVGGPKSEVLGIPGLTEQVAPFRSGGLNLVALDRKSFDSVWNVIRQAGTQAFDPRSVAVAGGRVFIASVGGTVAAFNLKDCVQVWKNDVDIKRSEPRHLDWDFTAWNPVTGFALEGVYVYSATEMDQAYTFDQETGQLLWSKISKRGHPLIPLAISGKLHAIDRGSGGLAFDPRSGEQSESPFRVPDTWCARVTASPHGIFVAEGQRLNLMTGELLADKWRAKSSCTAGSIVANGLLWKVPLDCKGCTQWLGILVRGQREHTPAPPERLAVNRKLDADGQTAAGWVTYRGNMERSGSSPAEIAATQRILWQTPPVRPPEFLSTQKEWSFDVEITPTAPVTSGETIVVCRGDGAVEALDLKTGQRRWRSPTGGRIYSSPTIWKNRVFVGSADGYLYCFALADGQELWRLRIAPDVGRMMLYGQSASRWPALGSPLVAGDKVVATAGLVNGVDGIWAAAADPVSGELLWQQDNWSAADPGGELTGAGQLCTQNDAIAYHGGAAPLVRLSASDGAVHPGWELPDQATLRKMNVISEDHLANQLQMYIKGQEIGSLSGDWLIAGGGVVFMDEAWSGNWRTGITFVNAKAPNGLPVLRASDSIIMPSWDEKDYLGVIDARGRATALVLISQATLNEHLVSAFGAKTETRSLNIPDQLLGGVQLDDEKLYRWKQNIPSRGAAMKDVFDTVLTTNAALLLWEGSSTFGLTAYDRNTGQEIWVVELPSVPLRRGVAVAEDGTIVISLRDGHLIALGK